MGTITVWIGVDGGGTGCRARVRTADGTRVGDGRGGPANVRLGHAMAWGNILHAIDGALAAAGLDRSVLADASVGLGLAGIVDGDGAAAMLAAGPLPGRARIVSDGHVACLGAFDGGDGGVLIVGTGSAAHVMVDGRPRAMFGWGFEVDDRGSAAALGRMAVQATLAAIDGIGPRSGFTDVVRARIGGDAGAIVAWLTAAAPRDYGALAPLAFAHGDDPVAAGLLAATGLQVDAMIAHMIGTGCPHVALVGGMAGPVAPLLSPASRAVLVFPAQDAVEGALLLAQENGFE